MLIHLVDSLAQLVILWMVYLIALFQFLFLIDL
jgi:hypothetical protein